ncbi:MAG: hypothetical protein VCA74_00095 [Deltaproteobacteria bacterium]
MKIISRQFVKGAVAGAIVGLTLGSVVAAWGAFGKKGWERFGSEFQGGYVAGFVDCVRLGKQMEPQGYMFRTFKTPRSATIPEWQWAVTEVYKNKKYQDLNMYQVMELAGYELEKHYGPDIEAPSTGPLERLREVLKQRRVERIEKARKAREAAQAESPAPPAP